jgi:acyl-CoA synthetase (AMP-forming)/AMP-acid ligase II
MTNLYSQLESSSARFGSKTALRAGETRVIYSEFNDLINAFAARLAADTEYDQRVGIRNKSRINSLAAHYACFWTGRTGVVQDPISLCQIVSDARLNAEVGDSTLPSSLRTIGTKQRQHEITVERADPCIIIYTFGNNCESP